MVYGLLDHNYAQKTFFFSSCLMASFNTWTKALTSLVKASDSSDFLNIKSYFLIVARSPGSTLRKTQVQ